MSFEFCIDRGGTFTDVYARVHYEDGKEKIVVEKLLSEDPDHYDDAPAEGIRRILKKYSAGGTADVDDVNSVRMGTTVATNALLERQGTPTLLLVTRGFKDTLMIGSQSRPNIFDLRAKRPDMLYSHVIEIEERVCLRRTEEWSEEDPVVGEVKIGVTGEEVVIEKPLDTPITKSAVMTALRTAMKDSGCKSVAIALTNSYTYPLHEVLLGDWCKEVGFSHITLSHLCTSMVRLVPRALTTCVDAYLTPVLREYVSQFGRASGVPPDSKVLFMQSDGGLTSASTFDGCRAVLSGPAGGYIGYARTAFDPVSRLPVIGFDMGGTSTDISRYAGELEHTFDASAVAGVAAALQVPQLSIHTVASGGGSRLLFASGLLQVGPESAGAHPGPVCYRKSGGRLAVTDANLVLGRIRAEFFPQIFGERGDQGLDRDAAWEAIDKVAEEVGKFAGTPPPSVEELAAGFIRVANEQMARPIRAMTVSRGFPIRQHVLACFGGAGAQHACEIARSLGIKRIHISRYAGILSAYGLHLADVHVDRQLPSATVYTSPSSTESSTESTTESMTENSGEESAGGTHAALVGRFEELTAAAKAELRERYGGERDIYGGGAGRDGEPAAGEIETLWHANMRYAGSDMAMMIPVGRERDAGGEIEREIASDFRRGFEERHREMFGFIAEKEREVLVDDVRVRAVGKTTRRPEEVEDPPNYAEIEALVESERKRAQAGERAEALDGEIARVSVYLSGAWSHDTPVYRLETLAPRAITFGPALIMQSTSTILVQDGWGVYITPERDCVLIDVGTSESRTESSGESDSANAVTATTESAATVSAGACDSIDDDAALRAAFPVDFIDLSVFANRFMSVAEQMGFALQRTAVSTNIKERLDFSCAVFDARGDLIANAPHIPVHLGAMSEAVKWQIQYYKSGKSAEEDPQSSDLAYRYSESTPFYLESPSGGWNANDVLLSNHPASGGTHLPDLTVITPCYLNHGDSSESQTNQVPSFYVASRGHHADIGGVKPGSMPPFSTSLSHEGVAIKSMKIVRHDSGFREDLVRHVFAQFGARKIRENVADLKAQIAANQRGIQLLREFVKEQTEMKVQAYMRHVLHASSSAIQSLLSAYSLSCGFPEVHSIESQDYMDDGSVIRLKITIDRKNKSAVFDFSNSDPEVYGNTNAPVPIVRSAVIYCLRAILETRQHILPSLTGAGSDKPGEREREKEREKEDEFPVVDIPLNAGCLWPVQIKLPSSESLLNPSDTAAVVGGNVLTSQRLCDVVLTTLGISADSQGCMNNLTFGSADFGYYETICGGAGAGPTWSGTSGIHTHMTNTRITDVEIVERRYPVVVRRFGIREGSGGPGHHPGGDGVIRDLEFRTSGIEVQVLTERRSRAPKGMCGGGDGRMGKNWYWERRAGTEPTSYRILSLGGKNTVTVSAGDRIVLETPGGGGYGEK